MHLKEAILKISDIHDQLLKSEVYRGFRASHMILIGLIAFVAALFQPAVIGLIPDIKFIYYWLFTAVICCGISVLFFIHNYYFHKSYLTRKRTPQIIRQFIPGIAAGAIITSGIISFYPVGIYLLPGIWSICFALSIFSIIPYFLQTAVWIAIYYFIAGFVLIYLSSIGKSFSEWGMGLTFGCGHISLGILIFLSLEKSTDEKNVEF